ncbi:AH receptor-interacting protein [Neodiprion pinetum]|uniref:AH receptor-interacting protein n=1 Tax=Neodiprion lecontei TaxID=441921 RepID=A0A6J0C799_NEOLC|nr:AH receptor-interacting protein [Neodiprion lecontei]XP_046428870.1 AH receptor-interacting protein [Neodiprion fabricii]XP_046428871.1 AH receptor-interacting protein [Neodiprion fabricii]XP_046428872.1 AH receptor-interacting protein [Neodiprion fabricii]XP_046485601.1 AH receptor-interacting protein [Neodiprion pinetum]XP_046485602.1 AH receptor-interacting protein [Neodiprion pinetum]XP_046485603.1 AH receptor-interacting protein [Neodiprion pinetum]XP_046598025.1 AH receptor-interact
MENKEFIQKSILHTGTKFVNFSPGTKVRFHFKTTRCNEEKTVVDDSRVMGEPMELVLGKKFKLEVWEVIVQKMALKEIARFRVDKSLVTPYPFVSKTLREVGKPLSEKRSHHCCGVMLQNEGIGYDDLNDLIKNPQDLEFTIELLDVVSPSDYEKETWQMTEDEKLNSIPTLREKGNTQFKEENYKAASDTYATAIGMLEQLMLKEKPNDEEWLELQKMKVPLLLNFAQCKLLNKEYYAVIEHCTTVLKSEPDNVKALYRRGKAHIGVWNEKEAKEDLERAAELNPALRTVVDKELSNFQTAIKEKDKLEKNKLAQIFAS